MSEREIIKNFDKTLNNLKYVEVKFHKVHLIQDNYPR